MALTFEEAKTDLNVNSHERVVEELQKWHPAVLAELLWSTFEAYKLRTVRSHDDFDKTVWMIMKKVEERRISQDLSSGGSEKLDPDLVVRCAKAAHKTHLHECGKIDLLIRPTPYDHLEERAKKIYMAIAEAVLQESKKRGAR